MAKDCYYADERYSEGSILVVEGEQYSCHDGVWFQDVEAPPGDRLTDDDTSAVRKKAARDCYYAGKRYSSGAPLKMPNGQVYRCEDGSWKPPPK